MTTVFFLLILTFCIYSEHTIVLTVFLWLPIHSNESKVLLTNSSIGRHVPNRCINAQSINTYLCFAPPSNFTLCLVNFMT